MSNPTTQNIDNWTVKQPWKILKSFIFKELTFKNSKKGKDSQVDILTKSNINQRVWSWLRMNAGGVLNTCKSNEAPVIETSVNWPGDLVADGWVTRG